MPRSRRQFVPGRRYLISQDGNKLFPIYLDTGDYRRALQLLQICSRRYRVRILDFGYEPHRAWWVMQPFTANGISDLMRDMQSTYSRYLNRKYKHRPGCSGQIACGQPPHRILASSNFTPRFRSAELHEPPKRTEEAARKMPRVRFQRRATRSRNRSFVQLSDVKSLAPAGIRCRAGPAPITERPVL